MHACMHITQRFHMHACRYTPVQQTCMQVHPCSTNILPPTSSPRPQDPPLKSTHPWPLAHVPIYQSLDSRNSTPPAYVPILFKKPSPKTEHIWGRATEQGDRLATKGRAILTERESVWARASASAVREACSAVSERRLYIVDYS